MVVWGHAPTFREIGTECGISPGTVHEHLNALEKRGLLQRNTKERRSIQLTEQP
jgi:DNA-binding MarR family transcriptional regulator